MSGPRQRLAKLKAYISATTTKTEGGSTKRRDTALPPRLRAPGGRKGNCKRETTDSETPGQALTASPSSPPAMSTASSSSLHSAMPVAGPSSLHMSQTQAQQHQIHAQTKKQRKAFLIELNAHLYDFVLRLLPTQDELAIKEDVRRLLEKLIRSIEPDSRLLAFGSTANGFSLRNSDMDLCCIVESTSQSRAAAAFVTLVGDLLEHETKFTVKTLPHARIPIVKLALAPSPGLPFGISCDIGFENRLALENTRLLHTYASVDPARVRTIVLFLKVWSKRRKINSPYEGTLSSYGFVLLVIYFLVHVKSPPVLPNLQQWPHDAAHERDRVINGNSVWFQDDVDLLRQRWQSPNTQSVAELLAEMFRYYAKDFAYGTGVASIRNGPLRKDAKGWTTDQSARRDGNLFCIEDPFEAEYNVARCVSKDGLFLIRGEFMRASRILTVRHDNALHAIAQLCAERDTSAIPVSSPGLPPAQPYTVGARARNADGARALSPLPMAVHYAPGGTPNSSVVGSPNPSASPSPSMRDADDFSDTDAAGHQSSRRGSAGTGPDDDNEDSRSTSDLSALDGDDGASVASAPMHHQQHLRTSRPARLQAPPNTFGGSNRGRFSASSQQQQQQQQQPLMQQAPRPVIWTGAGHPPGYISHHPRRSASAGAEPWRNVSNFPPYHVHPSANKPGQPSSSTTTLRPSFVQPAAAGRTYTQPVPMSVPVPVQVAFVQQQAARPGPGPSTHVQRAPPPPQFATLATQQAVTSPSHLRGRRSARGESRSGSSLSCSRSRSRSPSEDATPRNPHFRVTEQTTVPPVVLPAGAPRSASTRFAFGSMSPPGPTSASTTLASRDSEESSSQAATSRTQTAQRHSSGPGGFSVEDLARLRADEDSTPRASASNNTNGAQAQSQVRTHQPGHAYRHSTPLASLMSQPSGSSSGSSSQQHSPPATGNAQQPLPAAAQSQSQPPRIEIVPATTAQTIPPTEAVKAR